MNLGALSTHIIKEKALGEKKKASGHFHFVLTSVDGESEFLSKWPLKRLILDFTAV